MQALTNQPSAGKWKLTVFSSTSGSKYLGTNVRLSATADEHTLKFECNAGQNNFQVCDAIQPSVQLLEEGVPITNATVTATIYQPGEDIGDLLAQTPAPNIARESTESGSCALRKYTALQQSNPAIIKRYESYQPTTLTLKHVGNGLYKSDAYKANVTGVYKVIYKADATTTNLGIIQRAQEQTLNVRFPELTYKIENRKAEKPDISHDNQVTYFNYTLHVQPTFKDCNGKERFVGPGWEHDFRVSGGQITNAKVTDQCDSGRYTINLTAKNKFSFVKINLLDEPIYRGFLNDFNKPYNPHKWQIGLSIGKTFPKHQLDTFYNSSLFVKLSIDRRISHSLSFGLVTGHWRFANSFYINGATVGGDWYFYNADWLNNTPVDISLGTGIGIFKPKGLNTEAGGTLHGCITGDIKPRLSLFIEAAYYKLWASKYDFGAIGIGFRVKL